MLLSIKTTSQVLRLKSRKAHFSSEWPLTLSSKSGKIGFVGGMESELIKKFEVGFRAGVQAVNPKAVVKVKYAGGSIKPMSVKQPPKACINQA